MRGFKSYFFLKFCLPEQQIETLNSLNNDIKLKYSIFVAGVIRFFLFHRFLGEEAEKISLLVTKIEPINRNKPQQRISAACSSSILLRFFYFLWIFPATKHQISIYLFYYREWKCSLSGFSSVASVKLSLYP